MLLKLCKCGKLIPQREKYCKECNKTVNERHKEYNKYRRNKKHNAFYFSTPWIKVRAKVLQDFNYIDIYQYYVNNKVVKAEMVHHIVELEEDWSKRLEVSNLIPLSNATHNMITNLYKDERKRKELQKLFYELIDRYRKEIGGY